MREPDTTNSYGVLLDTRLIDVAETLKKLCPGKSFIDLGSGMGAVVALAQQHCVFAHGLEIDPDLCSKSLVSDSIKWGDARDADLSAYQVIYYYLEGSANGQELIEKIAEQATDIVLFYYRGCSAASVEHSRKTMKSRFSLETVGCLDIYRRIKE